MAVSRDKVDFATVTVEAGLASALANGFSSAGGGLSAVGVGLFSCFPHFFLLSLCNP
jgi:hypothetical protein